ncbi:hypothetical protein AB0P17_20995 [Streptomyces sp. NPDC088124]|uniref:hypothetical protein n=1 Tax=Streptomyces sp. NPDC088124 TaxID=3154654 RepID=UPI003420FEA2
MRDRVRIACRAAAVAIALAAAGGATIVPAVAAPAGITQTAPAPAPTGLTYSYDAATEQVTVSWDPKDPADTVTTGYREGSCAGLSSSDGPCFVRVSQAPLTGSSFTFRMTAGRTHYFILCAENAAHQLTRSAILTITT